MSAPIEKKIEKIPVIGYLAKKAKGVKLPFLEGLPLYDLLELYFFGMIKGAFSYRAGSVAFSFFLAMFPFALFILNLIPYIPVDNFQTDFLEFVEDSVPPTTYDAIELILIDIMHNSYQSLLSTGVIFAMIFMANGIHSIISGFEASYHITSYRNFFRAYLIAMGLSVIISLLILLSVAFFLTVEVFTHVTDYPVLAVISRYVFMGTVTFLVVSLLYKVGTKETRNVPFFSYGSVLTTLLIGFSSYLFGIYVLRFAKYNELYGSIGSLLVFMIFIWINCLILLLGFELNATIFRLKKNIKKNIGK